MNKHIAMIGFESHEDSILVGEFDTKAEAQSAADSAASEADDMIMESGEMFAPASGYVISPDSSWKVTVENLVSESRAYRESKINAGRVGGGSLRRSSRPA